jgi:hypothetical protein
LNAPRGLNDPVCCKNSSFNVRMASDVKTPGSRSSTGVRRTNGAMRCTAFSTSKRVTSSGWSPGDMRLMRVSNHVRRADGGSV